MSQARVRAARVDGQDAVPSIKLGSSLAIFGVGALLLLAATRLLVPLLTQGARQEPLLAWFLAAGLGVFAPLLLLAGFLLHRELGRLQRGDWSGRFRFRPLRGADWAFSVGSIAVIAILGGLIATAVGAFAGQAALHPSFLPAEPLSPGRYWLLWAWLPYWALNIVGEEVLWRGLMLPRQEAAHGSLAWVVHGLGWALFHVAFGWQLLLTLLPMLFVLPFAVQRTKNSSVGVVIHAGVNGPAFLAISLGAL